MKLSEYFTLEELIAQTNYTKVDAKWDLDRGHIKSDV